MSTPTLPGAVSEAAREFLKAKRFASVATLLPDGTPHVTVLWYALEDGDTILLNGAAGRQWCRNLERDPRVSVAVPDGYDYVELRGHVEIDRDHNRAQADIQTLLHRYHTDPNVIAESTANYAKMERISYRFKPSRVRERFGQG